MDAYSILGISKDASEEEIKKAYKERIKKYSSEEYSTSPLKEEAEAEMQQINAAFDELMGAIRTNRTVNSSSEDTKYAEIRKLINGGGADEAIAQLNAMSHSPNDAEWNFLLGSAYYYKGHLNKAMSYFETACRLEPDNREYSAAYQHLKNNANGNMQGNPYAQYGQGYGSGCTPCDICNALICLDCLCGCGRGGC